MFHPTRDGCRGGREKFDWNEIKNDRSRMNYLGNSIKAPSTRGGKDLFWYTKEQKASDNTKTQLQRELDEQKERESKLLGFYLAKGFGAKPPEELVVRSESAPVSVNVFPAESSLFATLPGTNMRTAESSAVLKEHTEKRTVDRHSDETRQKRRKERDHRDEVHDRDKAFHHTHGKSSSSDSGSRSRGKKNDMHRERERERREHDK